MLRSPGHVFRNVRKWNTLYHCRKFSVKSAEEQGIFQVAKEVREALHYGKPVVALESTIITHGMPFPDNIQTAMQVEETVREVGCVPATIGVLHGKIHVGMTQMEIEELGSSESQAVKLSVRDLSAAVAQRLSGGTTVSATMSVADKAGIPIFVTGGIGGVHRGAETSFDISSDLTELGRTAVTVVSAGVKSILDIEKTLEFLETQSVCVATLGPSNDFPAFFTRSSGFQSPHHVTTVEEAAALIYAHRALSMRSGVLLAVPVPESQAADAERVKAAIEEALVLADAEGVRGKDVTPFILKHVNEATGGNSLQANIALIKNNALIGSQVALELSKLGRRGKNAPQQREVWKKREQGESSPRENSSQKTTSKTATSRSRPVVIGATIVDLTAYTSAKNVEMNGATYPGYVKQSLGGVGRNMADCMSRLGQSPLFISAVGNDSNANFFFGSSPHMDLTAVQRVPDCSSALYCALIQGDGEMLLGIGDMEVNRRISPDMVGRYEREVREASMVVVDSNIEAETLAFVLELCGRHGVPVWFEPTELTKSAKPFQTPAYKHITISSPNLSELCTMHAALSGGKDDQQWMSADSLEAVLELALPRCRDLLEVIPVLLVTIGHHGVLLCHRLDASTLPHRVDRITPGKPTALHYPARFPSLPDPNIVSVSGAGDCMAAAVVSSLIEGHDLDLSVKAGLKVARHNLGTHQAVANDINAAMISPGNIKNWAQFSARQLNFKS